MYAIKIMSSENMADSDVGKGFKMIMVEAGDTFEFGHDPHSGEPQVTVTGYRAGDPTLVTYPVTGNCYVLSETGKTIASFWGRSKVVVHVNDLTPETAVNTIGVIQKTFMESGHSDDPVSTRINSTRDQIADIRKHLGQYTTQEVEWYQRGLTEDQIRMLKDKPPVPNNEHDRVLAYRARTATLMINGIPQQIAFDDSGYLIKIAEPLQAPEPGYIA